MVCLLATAYIGSFPHGCMASLRSKERAKFRFRSSLFILVTLVDHLYDIHLQRALAGDDQWWSWWSLMVTWWLIQIWWLSLLVNLMLNNCSILLSSWLIDGRLMVQENGSMSLDEGIVGWHSWLRRERFEVILGRRAPTSQDTSSSASGPGPCLLPLLLPPPTTAALCHHPWNDEQNVMFILPCTVSSQWESML